MYLSRLCRLEEDSPSAGKLGKAAGDLLSRLNAEPAHVDDGMGGICRVVGGEEAVLGDRWRPSTPR